MNLRSPLLGVFATASVALTAPADAVTKLNYEGPTLIVNIPALGSKISAEVILNRTLAPNYTGEIGGGDITTFTIKSLGGPSITANNGLFADFSFLGGNVTSWNLAATSPAFGNILLGTRKNPLGTDTAQAFNNNGTLPNNAQNYTFNSGAWTVQSIADIPEPATWGLMGIGFGLIGAAARRSPRPSSVNVGGTKLDLA
jgi:hypothetical protein